MTPERILIIEDDRDIAFLLERTLRKEGYETLVMYSGEKLRERINAFRPSLVLLDIMLPDADGFTLCRAIKSQESDSEIKVILLTARSEENDILNGFRCGADDYIPKPFHVREVVARAKAVLRRKKFTTADKTARLIRQGPLVIDDSKHEASVNDEILNLTISEYRLLRMMASQPKRVYTREQLGVCVSDNEPGPRGSQQSSRNIDVHIRSLRKKLDAHRGCIKTLRGVGYYFEKAASENPAQPRDPQPSP